LGKKIPGDVEPKYHKTSQNIIKMKYDGLPTGKKPKH